MFDLPVMRYPKCFEHANFLLDAGLKEEAQKILSMNEAALSNLEEDLTHQAFVVKLYESGLFNKPNC